MPANPISQSAAVRTLAGLVNELAAEVCAARPVKFMEVCGTHTMAISAHGIRRMLDERLELLSGPGCPVCVTAQDEIDDCIALAGRGAGSPVVLTFGDMLRVPGRSGSLEQARADGADVRVLYSPLDGLAMARHEPERQFVFLGVGFETTAPTVAAALVKARQMRLANFSVLSMFKLVPPALRLIAASERIAIDGFILPGHVSTVIGTRPYRFLAEKFGLPCCVAGFEATDILESVLALLEQLRGRPEVANRYRRSVRPGGNPRALGLMRRVFQTGDAEWRGLGTLADSGLRLRPAFARFDARLRFPSRTCPAVRRSAPRGCRCGDVMLGLIRPGQCRLFGRACTPERPVGPCMVSSEGACAAYWKYER